MQIIGLCRFSYPALGGFQVDHDDPDARARFLYDAARMENRFHLFERLTLPSVRGQTDPDFTFLIVIGDNLPRPYRDRLMNLTRDVPQIVIQAHPPGPHRAVMQQAINSVRQPSEVSVQYRLDDDDAIALDFTARLRAEAGARRDALTGNRHLALDFTKGYLIAPGADGVGTLAIDRRFVTAGLAVMFEPFLKMTVMNFNHMRLERFMTCDSLPDPAMYLRGLTQWNDSRQTDQSEADGLRPMTPAEGALIMDRFGVDPGGLLTPISG